MPKRASRLVNLHIKNIAAVGAPANRRRWLVVKAAGPRSENERRNIVDAAVRVKWGSPSDYAKAYLTDIFDGTEAIISMNGGYWSASFVIGADHAVTFSEPSAVQQTYVEKKRATKGAAITFDDAMVGRQLHHVYEMLGERYGALMETIESIRGSDVEDKGAAIRAALAAFMDSMAASMPSMLAEMDADDSADDVEKAGRKISASRLAKLKTLYTVLSDIISEGEATMTEKKTPDASALRKMGDALAAMFGRAAGADEATIAELEKSAGEAPAQIPAPIQALLSKADADLAAMRTTNAALADRLEKSEQAQAKLHEDAELRKFADVVSGYKEIGLDPAKDAVLLKSIAEKLPKEHADRIHELFKAALAQKAASAMFTEIGSGGAAKPEPGSAVEEVEQTIAALMQKSETVDFAAARKAVFSANPKLYDRYRQETAVRV